MLGGCWSTMLRLFAAGFTCKHLKNRSILYSLKKTQCWGGHCLGPRASLESLSSDVFERRTSTRSGAFSLLICLDATKFVSVFTLKETICPRIYRKSRPKSAKSPLPVDVRRSKTSLLKLPIFRAPMRLGSRGPIWCLTQRRSFF